MFPTPRRLTIEKMASRRISTERKASRRKVISMPNLQDIKLPEGPTRNPSLGKVDTGVGKGGLGWTKTLLVSVGVTVLGNCHRNAVSCWEEMMG